MWTEVPSSKNKKPVNKDRFISKMFLRCVSPYAYFSFSLLFLHSQRFSLIDSFYGVFSWHVLQG